MPAAIGQDTEPQAPLSDTMERMLRPQGLFQNRLPPPAEWQQPYPPAPGAYPPGGQYPQANPYQQGSPYPPPPGTPYPAAGAPYPAAGAPYPAAGNQYPPAGAFQQAAPPQPWGPAPTGAMPPAAPGQPPAGYGAGGQYPQGGVYQDPYGNGQQFPGGQYGQEQFPGAQYGPGQFGPGQFGTSVQYGPDGLPLAGAGADSPGLMGKLPFKPPKRRVLVGGGAALVIVIVIAVALSSQGGSSSTTGNDTAAAASTPTATTSSGTTAMTQSQAATALSGLLSESGSDRADVSNAVYDVEECGNSLAKDAQVFSKAAANRRTLLTKLAQLPGASTLSPTMIADLTGAWQASATVDSDLAKWAQDQVGHCKKGNTKDPNYTATIPFDSKATDDKNAFVKLWNPLAKKDGLPTRESSDL